MNQYLSVQTATCVFADVILKCKHSNDIEQLYKFELTVKLSEFSARLKMNKSEMCLVAGT